MFKKEDILKRKYEKEIRKIINNSKFNIKEIRVFFSSENIKPFHSWLQLCGKSLIFPHNLLNYNSQ